MLAFQQRQASLRCCRMVRALFCLIPSGIMSRMSCITAARSSRSKWLSTRCFVTVLATPLECLPSNCRERRLPSHRSNRGTMPRMKNTHTRHPGAQMPTPGPLPTGPWWVEGRRENEETYFLHTLPRPPPSPSPTPSPTPSPIPQPHPHPLPYPSAQPLTPLQC